METLSEILFSTGTTGKSKGVMITHYGQMNMCESQNAVLNYSKDNVWLIPTPMNHAAGLRKTHMSMVRGSTVLLISHSLAQARRLAEYALFLSRGELVEQGEAAQLLRSPCEEETRRFLDFYGA